MIELFGYKGKVYIDAVQLTYSVGALIGYLTLVKAQLHISLSLLSKHVDWIPSYAIEESNICIFMAIVVILPVRKNEPYNVYKRPTSP